MIFNLDIMDIIARVIVLVLCLPVHECAHAFTAYKLGDTTAKRDGRLTLNPFVHLDLFGSISLLLTGFGWAKPVPVETFYFKNKKRDLAITAAAGPISNFLLAYISMILFKICFIVPVSSDVAYTILNTFSSIFFYAVFINIGLAIFNLIPIPPLDGSKILGMFTSDSFNFKIRQYQNYIFIGLILIMFTGILDKPISFLQNSIFNLFDILTGFLPRISHIIGMA